MAQWANVHYWYSKCNSVLGTPISSTSKQVINLEWLVAATKAIRTSIHGPKTGCSLLLSTKFNTNTLKQAADKTLVDEVVSYLLNFKKVCNNDCNCTIDNNCNCVCASHCNCLANCTNCNPDMSVCQNCTNCNCTGTYQCNCNCVSTNNGSNSECACDCSPYVCNCTQTYSNCTTIAAKPSTQNCGTACNCFTCTNCACACACNCG